LVSLRQYISTCKRGGNLFLLYLIFEPKHLVNVEAKDLYLFSLNDLIRIKSDTKLAESIAHIVKLSIRHVSSCSSCRAKGFFCDICSKSNESSRDIIFPFEVGRVASCPTCGTCFHTKCVQSNVNFSCSKCERRRQRTLAKSSLLPGDEEPSYQNSNAIALPIEGNDEVIESSVSSSSTLNS
jgi:run domain Beclin-1 interacting cysteine-rich containing protein